MHLVAAFLNLRIPRIGGINCAKLIVCAIYVLLFGITTDRSLAARSKYCVTGISDGPDG